jgi:opacity protein-like surface antigen
MRLLPLHVVTLLLAAAPLAAHAQGAMGIKAGLSYGTATNSGLAPDAKSRSGFAIGVGVVSPGPVGVGVEAIYAQRGFTSSADFASRRFDNLDVPVYLRLSMPNTEVTPFVYIGPQVSYELKCATDSGSCPDVDRSHVDFAAVIGGGVRLGVAGGLMLDARYVYGLSDLRLSSIQFGDSYQTRSLLVLLGIGF